MRSIRDSACVVLLLSLPMLFAAATPAHAAIRCSTNAQGQTECVFVDDDDNPIPPPAPVVDLNLTSDLRMVENSGQQCYDDGSGNPVCSSGLIRERAPTFEAWSASAWSFESGASQNSRVGPRGIFADGNVYAGPDSFLYSASSRSTLSIVFDVNRDSEFLLEGLMQTSGLTDTLWLGEDGVRVFEFLGSPDARFSQVIPLTAGRQYALYMQMTSNDQLGYAGADYSLSFRQIPEPGTWLLVLLGFGLLATMRLHSPAR